MSEFKGPIPPSTPSNAGAPTPQALREVEQHFTELVAGVEDHAIFLMGPSGIILSWNAGAERIKGYTAEEIIGKSFTTFYTSRINRQWLASRGVETRGGDRSIAKTKDVT